MLGAYDPAAEILLPLAYVGLLILVWILFVTLMNRWAGDEDENEHSGYRGYRAQSSNTYFFAPPKKKKPFHVKRWELLSYEHWGKSDLILVVRWVYKDRAKEPEEFKYMGRYQWKELPNNDVLGSTALHEWLCKQAREIIDREKRHAEATREPKYATKKYETKRKR